MCGIVGSLSTAPPQAVVAGVKRAMDALAHRGPDDSGLAMFIGGTGAPDIAGADYVERWKVPVTLVLGHRRLSILDLSSAGHQPMRTADGRFSIVLNGEIYNYLELRRELESRGQVFRSRSDTEVLLAAYVEWGAACLDRLTGMFAFVVVDAVEGRLFLARDCFGMKPLYLCRQGPDLHFASEIPPLLKLAGLAPKADPQRLYEYLELGSTDHGSGTLFAGVESVPAAHYIEVQVDRPHEQRPRRYWLPPLDQSLDLSFADAARRLRELFLESVSLHMRSDVQVGSMLSGGIDSSAIVMAMRALGGPALEIHTFSYIGGQGAVSEERWIDIVNTASGAVAHKVHLSPEEWTADSGSLIESQGEPFGTIAVYAQNRLFRAAAEAGVRVILDGQGADEMLGGYHSMWAAQLAGLLRTGRWLKARRLLTARAGTRSERRDALRGALGFLLPAALFAIQRRLRGHGTVSPWVGASWVRAHRVKPPPPWRPRGRRVLRERLWYALNEGSLPGLLRYEDRNAMAYSIESRLPFLSRQLTEFLLALPEEYLIDREGTSKAVFREAMRGLVPEAVLERKDKIGFAVPVETWLPRTPRLIELLDAAARIPAVEPAGFSREMQALRQGLTPTEREGFLLWRLAGLAGWARNFEVSFEGGVAVAVE